MGKASAQLSRFWIGVGKQFGREVCRHAVYDGLALVPASGGERVSCFCDGGCGLMVCSVEVC